MCGIAGYIDFNQNTDDRVLTEMVKTLEHRGPDNFGTEVLKVNNTSIGLGQARLSIIDLSANGNQPMHYKHFSLVYNGEIYNYKELKTVLVSLGHDFKTDSDTEVILHAYEEWGELAVNKFIGMFALALLDTDKKELTLVRDRAGVKPLFCYQKGGIFLFASELKAFYKHPLFSKDIDRASLALYFDFGYVPAPYVIFKNSFKVEPGQIHKIDLTSSKSEKNKYWEVSEYYKKEKTTFNYEESKVKLTSLLESACNYRMIADVPVGVFLSGGYDSSLVTAMLQKDRTEKIKTFTIGFETGNNEVAYAKQVSDYLGTEHLEYICTHKDAQKIIPELTYYFDEPFADSSAIPTMLVSNLAKKKVKVALSADGGDELFGGYTRYVSLANKLNTLNKIPNALHGFTKRSLNSISAIIDDRNVPLNHKIKSIASSIDKNEIRQSAKVFKYMNSLPKVYSNKIFSSSPSDAYATYFDDNYDQVKNDVELAMLIDYKMYMQNDILTKVDRATMSVSLEGREPLLDHRLIEFAATLPLEFKIHKSGGKRILKDITHSLIPRTIMERPKAGFSIPISTWLNGELSHLIDEYLSESALAESGLFNVTYLSKIVRDFKNDKLHYKTLIWKLLIFQMWYQKWIK